LAKINPIHYIRAVANGVIDDIDVKMQLKLGSFSHLYSQIMIKN